MAPKAQKPRKNKPYYFDSLAHPTLTGNWVGKEKSATFEKLIASLKEGQFEGACAVGIWGQEGFETERFVEECRRFKSLVPIAGWNPGKEQPKSSDFFEKQILKVRELGYRGIKIHPRWNQVTLEDPNLAQTLGICEELQFPVFLCTYFFTKLQQYPNQDPFESLVRLLKKFPKVPLVLVHGGGVELLKYSELARHNPNLLLDLSWTLLKYAGSSLDQDVKFLIAELDQRICIGSDFPEFGHLQVRERFETLLKSMKGLPSQKIENITTLNIKNFLQGTSS